MTAQAALTEEAKPLRRACMAVVRNSPGLLTVPAIGATIIVLLGALVLVPVRYNQSPQSAPAPFSAVCLWILFVCLVLAIVVIITQLVEAAVVHGAYGHMVGESPTAIESAKAAGFNVASLVRWTAARERPTMLRVSRLARVTRQAATYLVLPFIVIEGHDHRAATDRSQGLVTGDDMSKAALSALSWSSVAVKIGMYVLLLQVFFLTSAGFSTAVVAAVWIALVGASTAGIYRAAHYYFAVHGHEPPGFEATEIERAFGAAPRALYPQDTLRDGALYPQDTLRDDGPTPQDTVRDQVEGLHDTV